MTTRLTRPLDHAVSVQGKASRLLTFDPWCGQLNNARLCLETAFALAMLTHRTLVLPPNYRRLSDPLDRDVSLHPADYLDLGRASALCPIISHAAFMRHPVRARQRVPHTLVCPPAQTVLCVEGPPPPNSRAAEHLSRFRSHRRPLDLPPIDAAAPWLHLAPALENFAAFFFLPRADQRAALARCIRDGLPLNGSIRGLGDRLASRLGRFNAVHVRSTDFSNQYPEACPNTDELAARLEQEFHDLDTLYIATDDPQRDAFRRLARRFRVVFIEDLIDIPSLPTEWIACIEQVICARAQSFIGTRLSTFSAYIVRLRGHMAARDQRLRFTDGAWNDAMDADGAPPYSWCNWMAANHPAWGRDYVESWCC